MFFLKVVLFLFVYQSYCTGFFHDINKKILNVDKLQEIFDAVATNNEVQTKEDELSTIPSVHPTTDAVTTNNEVQTKEDELATTPSINQPTENGDCPVDKSLVSIKDIKDMITYFSNDLHIYKSMEQDVVPQAKDINQKHLEDLEQFDIWFSNQPKHLIHVLEGLSAVRKKTIEPETQKIAVILKDYPQVKEKIEEKQLNFNKLVKKLHKYENLCKYTCEEKELNHVFKRSIPEKQNPDQVCISIADLTKQITDELKINLNAFLAKAKENLSTINKTLTDKTEKFKIDLKEKALKEFGRTMYNVLNLEDQYQHFAQDMNATKTQNVMYTVKDLGLQIDSKLLELERLIEKYGNYCKNCSKGPVKRSVRQTKSVINVDQKSLKVHELIQLETLKYEMEINKIIDTVFKDINELLNDPAKKEDYLNKLKLKQKEITEEEGKERKALEDLKKVASPDAVQKLNDVAATSEVLLKNINDKIAYVKKITP